VAAFTNEERMAFFGSIGRDLSGSEHLFGLTSSETACYLAFRQLSLAGNALAGGVAEHVALYEKHRRACKVRMIEPGE
jgi:hypothetical protein